MYYGDTSETSAHLFRQKMPSNLSFYSNMRAFFYPLLVHFYQFVGMMKVKSPFDYHECKLHSCGSVGD